MVRMTVNVAKSALDSSFANGKSKQKTFALTGKNGVVYEGKDGEAILVPDYEVKYFNNQPLTEWGLAVTFDSTNLEPDTNLVVLDNSTDVITSDCSLANNEIYFTMTLNGDKTLANPVNATDGQRLLWRIRQDTTGSRTLVFGDKFIFGTPFTLLSAANSVTYFAVIYDAILDRYQVEGAGGSSIIKQVKIFEFDGHGADVIEGVDQIFVLATTTRIVKIETKILTGSGAFSAILSNSEPIKTIETGVEDVDIILSPEVDYKITIGSSDGVEKVQIRLFIESNLI